MAEKGTCPKHGEFVLREGCAQCVAERQREPAIGYTEETKAYFEEEVEPTGLADAARMAGAEVKVVEMVDTGKASETAVALRPGEDIEAHGYHNEALTLLGYAEARVIATVEDAKRATDDLSIIAKLKKAMGDKRKSLLEPLKADMDAIRDTYTYLMAPVLDADKITREKMLAYDAEQRRIRAEQEEINRLREEAAQKQAKLTGGITEVEVVEVAPEPSKSTSTEMGTARTTDHWKWEVVDFAALPDEYKVIDGSMLTAVARKHHDQKQVPGVRFYNDPIIAVRAR